MASDIHVIGDRHWLYILQYITIFVLYCIWGETLQTHTSITSNTDIFLSFFPSLFRQIHSHHNIIFLNLCGSLAIANILFLTGIEQTEDRVCCKQCVFTFIKLIMICMLTTNAIKHRAIIELSLMHISKYKEKNLCLFYYKT